MILPYLEDSGRYASFDLDGGFTGEYSDLMNYGNPKLGAYVGSPSLYPGAPCRCRLPRPPDPPTFVTTYFSQNNTAALFMPNQAFQCPVRPELAGGRPELELPGRDGRPERRLDGLGLVGFGSSVNAHTGTDAWYNNGVFYINSKTRFTDVTDGTSNTFMLGESWYMETPGASATAFGSWAGNVYGYGGSAGSSGCCTAAVTLAAANDPINNGYRVIEIYNSSTIKFDPGKPFGGDSATPMRGFGSRHVDGCNFVMCDGSVRFVENAIDVNIYRQLSTRADNLPSGSDGQ